MMYETLKNTDKPVIAFEADGVKVGQMLDIQMSLDYYHLPDRSMCGMTDAKIKVQRMCRLKPIESSKKFWQVLRKR